MLLESADAVTCVSDDLGRLLKKQFPGSYSPETIYNGIDLDFWTSKSPIESERPTNEQTLIVSVGALAEVKGHDVLIRAFPLVLSSYPDATLLLIGEGPRRSAYEALADSLGLSENVQFTGWLSPKAVRTRLQQASVFVFPSRHEGFGIALVEAMAVGVPIVASDIGGIPEVIGHAGTLVPPDEPEELSEAICFVLGDQTPQRNTRSRKRAQRFAWEVVVERYEQVLCRN
jgi:glycosyltransferase involved in cell wall biosynthesis